MSTVTYPPQKCGCLESESYGEDDVRNQVWGLLGRSIPAASWPSGGASNAIPIPT